MYILVNDAWIVGRGDKPLNLRTEAGCRDFVLRFKVPGWTKLEIVSDVTGFPVQNVG